MTCEPHCLVCMLAYAGNAQVFLLFVVPLYVLESLTLPCLRDGQLTVFISCDVLLENPDDRKRDGMEPSLLPDT